MSEYGNAADRDPNGRYLNEPDDFVGESDEDTDVSGASDEGLDRAYDCSGVVADTAASVPDVNDDLDERAELQHLASASRARAEEVVLARLEDAQRDNRLLPDFALKKQMTVIAVEAAEQGDHEAFARWLDLIESMGLRATTAHAEACLAGIQAGNERAYDALTSALTSEQVRLREENRSRNLNGIPNRDALVLESVVQCSEQRGLPAEGWIRDYSVNEAHRWLLTINHYSRMIEQAPEDSGDRTRFQTLYQQEIAAFAGDDTYPDSLVFSAAPDLVRHATDPGARAQLIDRFSEACSDITLTPGAFAKIVQMGVHVVGDREVPVSERAEHYKELIEHCADSLRQMGVKESDIFSELVHWDAAYMHGQGASPSEIIEAISQHTKQVMPRAGIGPDHPEIEADLEEQRRTVCDARDNVLIEQAVWYMEEGGVAAAKQFLESIVEPHSRHGGLIQCLVSATDVEHVEALRLSGLTRQVDPDLEVNLRYAKARLQRDYTQLSDAAIAYVHERHTAGHGGYSLAFAEHAFGVLTQHDAANADRLARGVLEAARAEQMPPRFTEQYSEWLIKRGDTDEARALYDYAYNSNTDWRSPVESSYMLWKLSKWLDGYVLAQDERDDRGGQHTEGDGQVDVAAIGMESQVVAQQAIDDLMQTLEEGELKRRVLHLPLGTQISETAIEAAAQGDRETTDRLIRVMLQTGNIHDGEFARACFAGLQAGNEYAAEVLSEALLGEQRSIVNEIKSSGAHADTHAGLLAGVIRCCEEYDLPADTWINKYGANAECRWELATAHYRRMAEAAHEGQGAAFRRFEQKAAEITDADTYPARFVYEHARYLLDDIKDPAIRAQVIDRFKEAGREIELNIVTFRELVRVGITVLEDPELATMENRAYFESTIELSAIDMRADERDSFDVDAEEFAWSIAQMRFQQVTPREILEAIIRDDGNENQVSQIRSALRGTQMLLLREYARKYAAAGDMASARLFIDSINDRLTQQWAFADCLSKVTNTSQLAQIRPAGPTLVRNRSLDVHIRYAEARLSGNPTLLADAVLQCGRRFAEDINSFRKYIAEGFAALRLRDPAEAARMARGVLATLREKTETWDMDYLSQWLIACGDEQEVAAYYRYANDPLQEHYDRSLAMSRLARWLANREAA